jgi:hypothetical protein
MPVTFYPHKPIDLLENYIQKEDGTPLHGEIEIYRCLNEDLAKSSDQWFVWHDLKLPKHSSSFNRYRKTSAQIDFLILCKEGVLVLEVKGGAISFKENRFFYGRNLDSSMDQDPFVQSEGYKHTLKDHILTNVGKCFFCSAVAFPHVDYKFDLKIYDENLLWTKYRATQYNNLIGKFIESVFALQKAEHKKYNRTYPTLDSKQIDTIKNVLSPIIIDRNRFDNINTLEWLQINNIEILESLSSNKRVMLEGPPGSGKTTMARAYIDSQIGKKGLYLCWNNLLMHYTKGLISKRTSISELEISTFSHFILKLDPTLTIEKLNSSSEAEYYEIVRQTIYALESNGQLPHFDYIIVDECQDLLDRGIDIVIDRMCGLNNSGLRDGNILMLYDLDQGYLSSRRGLFEIADLLKDYFAHYKLNEVKRSAQSPGIRKLAAIAYENPSSWERGKNNVEFPNVTITLVETLESAKRHIVKSILHHIRDPHSSLRGANCVLLIESKLLKDEYRNESGMHYWLGIRDVEELDSINICDDSNKLRYTSVLKFKGLEKETVVLLITNPTDYNRDEVYVGVTRAMNNLEVIIVE